LKLFSLQYFNFLNLNLYNKNIIYWLLLIFCFFPYLNILRIGTDTQPNALFIAVLILIKSYNKKIPVYYLLSILIFITSLVIFLISNFTKGSLLSFSNYTSFLIVPLAVYYTLDYNKGLSYKFFKNIIYIWFFVGSVQRFISRDFLNFLLSRSSGIALETDYNGRGVVGLAPEPTYYGSTIILFIIVYLLNFSYKKDYKLIFVLLFQLIFLSKSSTSILILFISLITFLGFQLYKISIKYLLYIFIGSIFLLISFFFIKPFLISSRFYNIFSIINTNPKLIFFDQSISERFNAIYFSIKSLFDQHPLPKGFNSYQNYILEKSLLPEYKYQFINYKFENYSRILSGYGMGFYELGFIGLLIPLFIFMSIKNKLNIDVIILSYVIFNFLLFTAMSLNNATILFIIGNMMFINYKKFQL
jgi:hypothetical protein